MDNRCGQVICCKNRERGAARLKFILIIALIAVVAYVGYQYVPVAYQASRFKVAMQDDVDEVANGGRTTEWLKDQLKAHAKEYSVPPDAEISIEPSPDGHVQARVKYTRPVAFPGYTYNYNFDYTAKSTRLLGTK